MAAKVILALCFTALVQSAYSQCCAGRTAHLRTPAYGHHGCGVGADIAAASSLNAAWGGGLGVASGSAVPPSGLNVASENVYEGSLAVAGNLPFLGTVAMEGVFPSAGAGAVSYACGDGALGITAETSGLSGIGYDGLGYHGHGYHHGLGYKGYAGKIGGCGCGSIY